MSKIIWMSDLHFVAQETIDGLDPRARLDRAIEHANTHHSDAQFIIVSGDLMHDDTAADYPQIAQHFAESTLPIHPMMGNNDDRAKMRDTFALSGDVMPGFVQYALETDDAVILCLDTHKSGSAAGELCTARLNWLEGQLAAARKPVHLFMHHPPKALHLPEQDAIRLDNEDRFLKLIDAHPTLRHLFFGHVHRLTFGSLRGVPMASLGAVSFQAPPPHPAWTWDTFVAAREAPQYGVIHITEDTTTVHPIQFCDANFGYESAAPL